jgi:hypothetical protein
MDNIYKTTDIVLAATLRLKNHQLVDIELRGKQGTFVFLDVEQEFLDDFDLGKHLVEPISFNGEIKSLTTIIRRKVSSGVYMS